MNIEKVSLARIKTEFQKFDPDLSLVSVSLVNNNYWHWKGFIDGPCDTPYEEGLFQIDIQVPHEYPLKPPKMIFQTKVWHPNISSVTGEISLDVLESKWCAALSIRTSLLSLQCLLASPNPDEILDANAGAQIRQDVEKFNLHAKEWVSLYASKEFYRKKIKNLMEMGFKEEIVTKNLILTGYDEERSLNLLLYDKQQE